MRGFPALEKADRRPLAASLRLFLQFMPFLPSFN